MPVPYYYLTISKHSMDACDKSACNSYMTTLSVFKTLGKSSGEKNENKVLAFSLINIEKPRNWLFSNNQIFRYHKFNLGRERHYVATHSLVFITM